MITQLRRRGVLGEGARGRAALRRVGGAPSQVCDNPPGAEYWAC